MIQQIYVKAYIRVRYYNLYIEISNFSGKNFIQIFVKFKKEKRNNLEYI